ncbi:DUF2716 domain-containing protein [Streptomyces albiaxialis]|uniref:DUF2716 domain-containing protein n=1 Tax=Streptomyces albiaxialis TaxID=329523 RepID=A0ABN2WS77_9ACTN
MDDTAARAGDLLAAYDTQVRTHVPEPPPVGAVIERDGPVVRTHYGTHATVSRAPHPSGGDEGALVRRQQEACAGRREPAVWRVYGHDPAPWGRALREAGFTAAGPERTLLVARFDDIDAATAEGRAVPAKGQRVRRLGHGDHRDRELRRLAEAGGGGGGGPEWEPCAYARGLEAVRADHGGLVSWGLNVQLLEAETRLVGAGWAEPVGRTEFVAVRGMTGPHAEYLPPWLRWARTPWALGRAVAPAPERRYVTAEAPRGPVLDTLLGCGFRAVTTVRDHVWRPPGPPPYATRPVTMLLGGPEHDALCAAFERRFAFRPGLDSCPAVEEPASSVTWHVGTPDGSARAERVRGAVQEIVERAARAATPPGEQLYALSWWHQGYRFDPARVSGTGHCGGTGRGGGPVRPSWPRSVCGDADYLMLLTRDLRMGTFWHPWEESLCVFGPALLAGAESALTETLGTVMRRGGRNVGNVWTYE